MLCPPSAVCSPSAARPHHLLPPTFASYRKNKIVPITTEFFPPKKARSDCFPTFRIAGHWSVERMRKLIEHIHSQSPTRRGKLTQFRIPISALSEFFPSPTLCDQAVFVAENREPDDHVRLVQSNTVPCILFIAIQDLDKIRKQISSGNKLLYLERGLMLDNMHFDQPLWEIVSRNISGCGTLILGSTFYVSHLLPDAPCYPLVQCMDLINQSLPMIPNLTKITGKTHVLRRLVTKVFSIAHIKGLPAATVLDLRGGALLPDLLDSFTKFEPPHRSLGYFPPPGIGHHLVRKVIVNTPARTEKVCPLSVSIKPWGEWNWIDRPVLEMHIPEILTSSQVDTLHRNIQAAKARSLKVHSSQLTDLDTCIVLDQPEYFRPTDRGHKDPKMYPYKTQVMTAIPIMPEVLANIIIDYMGEYLTTVFSSGRNYIKIAAPDPDHI